MKLEKLYKEDIDRRINPAVVVSELDNYHREQEIREYVFTPDLLQNLYKLLFALSSSFEGKTGVWVNGYYGSGKSHFIKYLFYCLEQETRQKALDHFSQNHKEILDSEGGLFEPNPAEVASLVRKLSLLEIDTLIFNIDVESKNKNQKEVITKIFLNLLNKFRGYNDTNIALALLLEKPLDKMGKYEAFQARVQEELQEPWKGNQGRFGKSKLGKVLEIALEFDENLDLDALRHAIKQDKTQEEGYSVRDLIREFQDFLSDNPDNYRLIFLIDEVSQYIGSDTSLLLNLQSIIEEIGTHCENKIWMVCTAQQDLKKLINNTDDKTEDFGKIMGRFETSISLESQSAAYITKKRVLEKSPEGTATLTDFYKQHKGAIENQFFFENDLYENYQDPEEFYLTYPFVPYQFQLISDVFASFSQVGYVGEGVKNTERSILGITHFTAQKAKDQETGYFIPFDLFFNEQLEKNLTHFARELLSRAYNIRAVKDSSFARRVVNALFMVSNLSESQRIQLPANLENLALFLIDKVDQRKLDMQKEVEKVLKELVRQNIIQESEGRYRFLKEDEIEVANQISNTQIGMRDRLEALEKDFLGQAIRLQRRIDYNGRTYNAKIAVDDKIISDKGDFDIRFSIFNNTDVNQLAHQSNTHELVFCLHPWYHEDEPFRNSFLQYLRTKKFVQDNADKARGERSETLRKFGSNNVLILKSLQKQFIDQFLKAPVISAMQVIQADQLKSSSPENRYKECLDLHLQEVYKKQKLASAFAQSLAELEASAKSPLQQDLRELSPAEEEIHSKLNILGGQSSMHELIQMYERPPFGWKDMSIIDILIQLGKKGKRRFEWRSAEVHDWLDLAKNSAHARERQAILIYKGTEISNEQVRSFVQAVNDIFAESLISPRISEAKTAVQGFKEKLKPLIAKANSCKEDAAAYPFAKGLKDWHESLLSLLQERNDAKLIERIETEKDTLRQQRDAYIQLEDFIDEQLKNYQEIRIFEQDNRSNFETLDETGQKRASELKEYFQLDMNPTERFPQMRRIYKELQEGIQDQVRELRQEADKLYEEIFNTLEKELKSAAQELEVSYPPNLLYPRDNKLNEIAKSKDINRLRLLLELNGSFEQENRQKIIHFQERVRADLAAKAAQNAPKTEGGKSPIPAPIPKVRDTIDYTIGSDRSLPRQIQDETQMREYLQKLEIQLRRMLKEDKIILLR